ncbi:hypothetical protein Bcep1808_7273 (plasmid) [Burkholderia vietnamiensis G4]|uniref:Uncharacterized protein n=1 Tax=Burkholderia vietnamiensis (strain G4 / LMG 22486) TaxID=269482 RepID=A4JV48_BURVG|nr:hypothetical protein Bcep1808_7273 [Burkholderia vietnamiensis G4]
MKSAKPQRTRFGRARNTISAPVRATTNSGRRPIDTPGRSATKESRPARAHAKPSSCEHIEDSGCLASTDAIQCVIVDASNRLHGLVAGTKYSLPRSGACLLANQYGEEGFWIDHSSCAYGR